VHKAGEYTARCCGLPPDGRRGDDGDMETATTRRRRTAPATPVEASSADVNEVVLRGAFSGPATVRTLPSDDVLCTFRVTVRRPPGDRVEVLGVLRRRFWRSPAGGPASRYEVEIRELRIMST
jgi:single-strand DNA-binding protein